MNSSAEISKEDVLKHFQSIAVYEYNFAIEKSKLKPFEIKRAAIFPYNKTWNMARKVKITENEKYTL